MVRGDGSYEKLEHQLLFLRERGLTSPEIDAGQRRLSLSTQLAGGDATKLDSQFVDRIHVELADATATQMKALGVFEEWLDSWDVHNGIRIERPEERPLGAGPMTTASSPADRFRELAEELQDALRALRGESVGGISEADEGFESDHRFEGLRGLTTQATDAS